MNKCDCGGAACGAGHSSWCSSLAKEVEKVSIVSDSITDSTFTIPVSRIDLTTTGITWIGAKPDNPLEGHVYIDENNITQVYSGGQWQEIGSLSSDEGFRAALTGTVAPIEDDGA